MRIFITGGLVVAATGHDPWPGGTVLIEEGRIVAAGAASEFSDPGAGCQVLDATGCTVMPGIIDSHIHVLSHPKRCGFSETEAILWGADALRSALSGGATTLRDMGAKYEAIFALKKGVEAGWVAGPRLLVCGGALTITGGHGHDALGVECDGVDGVTREARRQLKLGADVVKLMATSGVGTPGPLRPSGLLSVDEMRAAVEVAHRAGRLTASHCIPLAGTRNSLEAGVDSIEHGTFLDDEAIEMMIKNDTMLCPTLSAYRRVVESAGTGLVPDHMVQKTIPLGQAHIESFKKALAAGVRVTFGTDSGMLVHPLGNVALELEMWVEAGMSPLAVLETATRVTARACQIDHEVGTLEPGKRADVLIVQGNATVDIRAMRRVRLVLRDGVTAYQRAADGA